MEPVEEGGFDGPQQDDIRAGEVARISAGHDSAWRMTGEQDEAYNALGHALRLALSPDQVRWELATSQQRLLDAIASAHTGPTVHLLPLFGRGHRAPPTNADSSRPGILRV